MSEDIIIDPEPHAVRMHTIKPCQHFMARRLGADYGALNNYIMTNMIVDKGPFGDTYVERGTAAVRGWFVAVRIGDGKVTQFPPGHEAILLGHRGHAEPFEVVARLNVSTGEREIRVGEAIAGDGWDIHVAMFGDYCPNKEGGEHFVRRFAIEAMRGGSPRWKVVTEMAERARDLWDRNQAPAQLMARETIEHLFSRIETRLPYRRAIMKYIRGEEATVRAPAFVVRSPKKDDNDE